MISSKLGVSLLGERFLKEARSLPSVSSATPER